MKVCLAATTFPRYAGDGQGAFIWELARAIQRKGVEVHVVALHSPEAKTHEWIEGIEVSRPRYWWPQEAEMLRKDGGGLPMTLRKYPLARLQLPLFLLRHSAAIAQAASSCDLIHAHWTLSGAAALVGRWRYGKPLLLTVHGSDIFQVPRSRMGAIFTRTVLNRVDRISAVSEALKQATCAVGVEAAKVVVISNGIDLEKFKPPVPDPRRQSSNDARIILFAGFLIKRKGVRYLVEAISLLPPDLPPYRLVIVGDGPEDEPLRQQVAALGVAEQVEFAGSLSQAAVSQWMQRARLFVLPSLEEGQGVVLLEALAAGTPVIASDVDGMREVVAPEVGLRVPPADPPALAQAIATILRDDALWLQMSDQARLRALALYDWEKIGARFVELYEQLDDESRRPDRALHK